MNNKSNKKLLVLSFLFIIFWATITLANTNNNNFLNVRPVLNRAIQTIQKIAFNEDAIRHPEALDREVIVESNHGTVLIRWRVRALVDWTTGTLTPDSTGSSLFYWNNNYLAGTDSFIIAWDSNTITSEVSESAIIWGTNNTLVTWNNIYIIWGSGNTLSWVTSFIVWWQNNKLEWNNSYIIWGNNSEVHANWSIAAWSDIYIDKDNVFAWKDTSDDVKLNPKKDNTFILFAQNWISIWYYQPKDTSSIWTVDINWTFQVSTEMKRCGINIAGAVQYIQLVTWDVVAGKPYNGHLYGCFCTCDWSEWVSMIPSRLCRDLCPAAITWDVDEDFQNGVCRYTKAQNASIWSIDASQACDNWEAKNFNKVMKDWYAYSWSWDCVGNETTATNCWAMAKRQEWKCSSNPNQPGRADYFNKCAGWYPKIKSKVNNFYTWTCVGINAGDSAECSACQDNWNYYSAGEKKGCVDERWKCNSNFNGKNLGSLDFNSKDENWKWLCSYRMSGTDIDFKITKWEDWKQNWWVWRCEWEQSTAQCSATYRVDPWRCKATTVDWISEYAKCENGDLTWVTAKDVKNFVKWTCAWVNHPKSAECKWCPPGYKYNRKKDICERTCCEYEPWVTYYKTGWYDNGWYFVANTCHTSVTLMDKNLWAEATYEWGGLTNENESIGNYYQRWNNYWFSIQKLSDNRWRVKEPTTTDRPDWDEKYNRTWYFGTNFIVSSKNEEECLHYNYWTHPGKDKNGNNKPCTVHRDIWWWGIDWYVSWCYWNYFWMDTMYRVHSNDIQDYISDRKVAWHCWHDVSPYMLNTWAIARQWPCPEWWHVPSAWEWGALLTAYCEWKPMACKDDTVKNGKYVSSLSKWTLTRSVANETLWNNFSQEFKLPKWGRIMSDANYPWELLSKNNEGFYRSSSYASDEYVAYLWFNKAQIYATQTNGESKRWAPIRCFKNPEIINDDDPKNKCPDPYILTILYLDEETNLEVAPAKTYELGVNVEYKEDTPKVKGYKATENSFSIVMPNRNETKKVMYKKIKQ